MSSILYFFQAAALRQPTNVASGNKDHGSPRSAKGSRHSLPSKAGGLDILTDAEIMNRKMENTRLRAQTECADRILLKLVSRTIVVGCFGNQAGGLVDDFNSVLLETGVFVGNQSVLLEQ